MAQSGHRETLLCINGSGLKFKRMSKEFDPADYSFVVKRRGTPQKPWRWEIYCAGKSAPVERSPEFFVSMAEAAKEGKKALGYFLAKQAA
jgi:hypothetical protein